MVYLQKNIGENPKKKNKIEKMRGLFGFLDLLVTYTINLSEQGLCLFYLDLAFADMFNLLQFDWNSYSNHATLLLVLD